MSADEKQLTAGRAWAELTRALGRRAPARVREANRIARQTRALVGKKRPKRG